MVSAQGPEAMGCTFTLSELRLYNNYSNAVLTVFIQRDLLNSFEDDSGQITHTHIYSFSPDNLHSLTLNTKILIVLSFLVFLFQPAQSNICLIKSAVPIWTGLMCPTAVSCSRDKRPSERRAHLGVHIWASGLVTLVRDTSPTPSNELNPQVDL